MVADRSLFDPDLSDDELPFYVAAPGPPPDVERLPLRQSAAAAATRARHVATTAVSRGPSGAAGPTGPPPPSVALGGATGSRTLPLPGFRGLTPLPGDHLEEMLREWWPGRAASGVGVGRRLRVVGPPRAHGGTWRLHARLRRLTRAHRVTVVIELWPYLRHWTMVTMTPESRVLCTRRYYRIGHAALRDLTAALSATDAARSALETVASEGVGALEGMGSR